MNRSPDLAVEPRKRQVAVVVALLTVVAGAGCVDVNGGAVELSWSIWTSEGTQSDCTVEGANLARVALCAKSCDELLPSGGCDEAHDFCPGTWECDAYHGTTRFDIAPGRWALAIRPECGSSALPDVTVPQPIVREIAVGEVTQLNALLVVVNGDGPACPR